MPDSFHPGKTWRDTQGIPINSHGGGILHHEGIYYWYGECRPDGPSTQNALIGVSCYRSTDLYHWENLGTALNVVHDDPNHPLTAGCKIERPKVLFNSKTRKFVMWWHHDLKGWGHAGAFAGVAISETPQGPFQFVEIIKPGWRMCRDCTLFQDSDGAAYFIYATDDNANLCIHLLSDDYLKPTERALTVFPSRFMEAPCLFKHDNRYYFIGSDCTGWLPNEARSASAPSIWGPWKELGNPCLGDDADITFNAQSTFILPVSGHEGAFIFMADIWEPEALQNSTYAWLPIFFKKNPSGMTRPHIRWIESWDLAFFDPKPPSRI